MVFLAALNGLHAQGTAFTYQGQLFSEGGAANGTFDFTFTLFTTNAGGSPASSTRTNTATGVSNGLFMATLDFGAGVFSGTSYWLEMGVRTNGNNGFTILSPRQPITSSPYAVFAIAAATAGTAGNVSGIVPAAQLSGPVGNTQLAHDSITVTAGTGLGGGGAVALGGTIVLSNSGIISVTGNADVTAATAGGAVTLGDTATPTNTANTIVKRDGSGNFSAGTVPLTGPLTLVNPQNDTGVGFGVFSNNTTGNANTAAGFEALYANTTGSNNIALGSLAGYGITTGSSNIDIGNAGLAADANVIRIGSGQSQTFLTGSLAVNGTRIVDASGNWVGSATGLVGPQGPAGTAGASGPAGPAGATGLAGTNGNTIWHGTGAPASTVGTNGDFYINTNDESIYGPKTTGVWGGGTALIGPLDPFWDSKGFVTPQQHTRYCGPTVPLLRLKKRTFTSDETLMAEAEIAPVN